MTFQRRLCIIGTGLRRFGKRSSLVAILLLFLASCSTAPTDTTTPGPNTTTLGPNVTDHATELPTPVTVGDDPECEPDREWIRSGNTLTQRLELGFRSEESGAAVSVRAESLLITGDLSILDVQAVVEYDLYDLEAFGSSRSRSRRLSRRPYIAVRSPGGPQRGGGPARYEGPIFRGTCRSRASSS